MTQEQHLQALQTELKGYFERATAERKTLGKELAETTSTISAIQKQLDALDCAVARGTGHYSDPGQDFKKQLENDDQVQRLLRDKKGSAIVTFTSKDFDGFTGRKTTITTGAVGFATSGVLPIGRLDGITGEPRQQLTVRDLLSASPTTFQVLDFVKVLAPMTIASPVAEGGLKPENAVTFVTVSERVKTIATWIPATRQVLDDFSELLTFIKTMMPYYVNQAEELQLLSGDGTGENLHGLIPQATAFQAALLSATRGWNKIDQIGRAIQQLTAARELQPSFVILHPNDWWDIRLTKDGFGRYILGDPQEGAFTNTGFGITVPTQNIFGLTVDATTNIAPGTFLVGSGNPIAAEIRDRMEMQIDISTEHADFFTKNLVAVRAEKRLALVTRRPGSFISGSFSISPA